MRLNARGRPALAPFALLPFLAIPTPARAAVPKNQCIDADGQGQSLRIDGKFTSARLQLEICSDPSCPAIVRSDCAQRLVELEGLQPTVVFDVTDPHGSEVGDAHLRIDGQPADMVEGATVRVDPGEHEFLFTAPGRQAAAERLAVKEGEKGRLVHVTLGALPSATPKAVASAPVTPAPPSPSDSKSLGARKILGLAAGGTGVAGVAVGVVFGALTLATANRQKTDCASPFACSNHGAALSDHAAAQTDGAVSTGAFLAGGALIALGAWLFFGAPAPAETDVGASAERAVPADRRAWSFGVMATPAGGGISLRAEL